MKRRIVVTMTVLMLVVTGTLFAQAAQEYVDTHSQPTSVSVASSTGTEEGMLHMREEEKLARDVYLALHEKWGIRTFAQIARSEQRHMDAMAALLVYQGVQDPVAHAAPGVFTIPSMQSLYDELVSQGSESPLQALTVGAMVEDLDIHDLQNLLATTDDPIIVNVYSSLLRASGQHLRTFTRLLDRFGAPYEPRWITADDFAAIMNR